MTKKKINNAKAVINLRKLKDIEEWALVLEVLRYQEHDYDDPTHKVEYLDMTITTPLFDKSAPVKVSKNGVESFAPIRDSRGIIMCTSYGDQKKCQKAEKLRKKRQDEIDRNVFYTDEEKKLHEQLKHGDEDFIKYFEDVTHRLHPNSSRNTLHNWRMCIDYLKDFCHGNPLPFKTLNMKFGNDFRAYILTRPARRPGFTGTISQASAATFFSVFKAALKQAFVEEYLHTNLGAQLKGISAPRPKRETLDREELRKLAASPCRNRWVKRAALFTAFTGLRHSDIKRITWSQFKKTPDGWRLDFVQKKTGMPEYLPISEQAYALCGKPGNPYDFVFDHLPEINNTNKIIHEWVSKAGIDRRITYHCFRHTFATLLLQQGTDLLTIKAMLGHTRVTTTEIYTHIIDDSKTQAAGAIKIKKVKFGKK